MLLRYATTSDTLTSRLHLFAPSMEADFIVNTLFVVPKDSHREFKEQLSFWYPAAISHYIIFKLHHHDADPG